MHTMWPPLAVWAAVHALVRCTGACAAATTPRRAELFAVSLVHAALVTWHGFFDPVLPWRTLLSWMAGYFAYDVAWTWRWMAPTIAMHHACALWVALSVRDDPAVVPLLPILCKVELSTVFLNIVYLQRQLGLERSAARACAVSKLLFAASFVAVRIVWMPPVLARELAAGGALAALPASARAAVVALAAANFWWLRSIVRRARLSLPSLNVVKTQCQ